MSGIRASASVRRGTLLDRRMAFGPPWAFDEFRHDILAEHEVRQHYRLHPDERTQQQVFDTRYLVGDDHGNAGDREFQRHSSRGRSAARAMRKAACFSAVSTTMRGRIAQSAVASDTRSSEMRHGRQDDLDRPVAVGHEIERGHEHGQSAA